jgi:hypothetical protein
VKFNRPPDKLTATEEPTFFDLSRLTTSANAAKETLDRIGTTVYNLAQEGSLDQKSFQDVVEDMEQINTTLKGTMFALNN